MNYEAMRASQKIFPAMSTMDLIRRREVAERIIQRVIDAKDKTIAEIFAGLAEQAADNAALLKAIQENWLEYEDVDDVCRFCAELVINAPQAPQCNHKPDCITQAEHPGTQILVQLSEQAAEIEKLEKKNEQLKQAIENAPSPDQNLIVFGGCDVCAVPPEALEELKSVVNQQLAEPSIKGVKP